MESDPQDDGIDMISSAGSTRNDRKRNLVNQRNFRSRRKQYIEELEGKVQAYERQGVAASQQVQDAARALIAENEALRHIIFQQLGWRPEYLNSVISQPIDQQFSSIVTNDTLHHTLSARNYEPASRIKEESHLSAPPATNGYTDSLLLQQPHQHVDHPHLINGLVGHQIDVNNQNAMNSLVTEATGRINGTHGQPRRITTNDPKAVMSCEHAASILADLRTQGSVDSIRTELGCKPMEACDIPHEVVFERMDRSM